MNRYIFLLFILIATQACKKQAGYKASIIRGTATPVYLNPTTTEIELEDYFLDPSKIDSVGTSMDYNASLKEDKTSVQIKGNNSMGRISNLRVWVSGIPNDIPFFKTTKERVKFSLPHKPDYKSVGFKSQIVNWQTVPMQRTDKAWVYETELEPGKYQYLYVINGKEQTDPNNLQKISNGFGGFNSIYTVIDSTDKTPFLQTETHSKNNLTFSSKNSLKKAFVYIDNQLLSSDYIKTEAHSLQITIPKNQRERSQMRIYAYNEFSRSNDVLIPLHKGRVVTDPSQLQRSDFHTQILYFLMVDRFFDGDISNTKPVKNDSILPKANYMGGDLQGVLDKIKEGYFSDLGINTIWLSPITQNPEGAYGFWPDPMTKFSGYHGYWPISNTQIDYRYGDEKVFKDLLDKAHEKEFNVLLDYVANHVHEDHPLYKAHPDWATNLYLPDGTMNTEKWDEHRLTTWFDTFLPTLDFSKPEVVEKMTDSAAYWITQYELDGFRHDATKHIQLDFWRTLTKKIKQQTQRPIFQIGETYGSPELIRSYVNTGMLDGQFNFNLYDTSVAVFAGEEPMMRLSDALTESLKYYGNHHLMGNITGNQDRARFISYASGDVRFDEDAKKAGWTREIGLTDKTAYKKLAMLHAFNLTTPGIPCIYYGDEYGSIGGNDPDNRKMMKFEGLNPEEEKLRETVKKLIHLRRNSMSLLYGSTEILRVDKDVLVIKRKYFEEEIIIAFNKSNKSFNFMDREIAPDSFEIITR